MSKRNPKDLIEVELPGHFNAVKSHLSDDQKKVSMKFGADIEGSGQWTLTFANGELDVKPGLAPDFDIAIATSTSSFDAALNDNPDLANFDPAKIDFARLLKRLKPELADQVRQISGSLKMGLLDADEELMSATVKFGAAAPVAPTCEIYVQESDARELAEGGMNPQQAFMAGKIQIKGDMTIAMQLATIMMS